MEIGHFCLMNIIFDKPHGRYPCISFHSLDNPPDKFALLRHDIDMSPRNALELQKLKLILC